MCSASNAAQALLLLLPEWRLAAILPPWRQHGAMRRILTTLLDLLPPTQPRGFVNGSLPAAGHHARGAAGDPPSIGASAALMEMAAASQAIGGRAAPLLQLASTVLLLSRDHPPPLIEEILAMPADLSRYAF